MANGANIQYPCARKQVKRQVGQTYRGNGSFDSDKARSEHGHEVFGYQGRANDRRPEGQYEFGPILRTDILQTLRLTERDILRGGHPGRQIVGCTCEVSV